MLHRPTTKLFVDSKYMDSSGNFQVPGEAIMVHPTTRVWLAEASIVASFDTIDSTNDSFEIVELGVSRTVTISNGPHDIESLREAIESSLNFAPGAGMGTYTVTRISTGSGGSTFRSYRVTCSAGTFAIPAVSNKLSSICAFPNGDTPSATQVSSFVDVRRVHAIYIHTTLGANNAIAPNGSRSILAKIPVTVGYGSLIHVEMSGSEYDYVEAGCHAISNIRLTLHDVDGNELDLHGTRWSATLVFAR